LKAHAAQLEARLTEAHAQNQQWVQALAAARKTSRNSSKRPSSDIVKPPPKPLGKGKRRKIGAQPGHPKHEHPAFTPAQIDHPISYELEHCPVDPSHRLVPLVDQQKIIQPVELVEQPFRGHRAYGPRILVRGLSGYSLPAFPQPWSLVALRPAPHQLGLLPQRQIARVLFGIQDFFRDVLGLEVSRGYLAKLNQKAARAFAQPYAQLLSLLPQQVH